MNGSVIRYRSSLQLKRKIAANLKTEEPHVKLCAHSGGIKRGIAIPLLSLRVRVHRERGSRNPLSLCDSLVTFCSHRKSPCGAYRIGFSKNFHSERRALLLRYLYICCLYTDGVTPSRRLNTAMKLLIFMYPVSSAICEMLLFVSRSSSFASAIFLRFM